MLTVWRNSELSYQAQRLQRERHRAAQFHAATRHLPLALAFNVVAVLLAQPLPWVDAAWCRAWTLALTVLLSLNFGLWWRFTRPGLARRLPPHLPTVMTVSVAVIGSLYGLGAAQLLPVVQESERMLLVAVAAAFCAIGAWLHAPLPRLGLAWSAAFGGSAVLGLLLNLQHHPMPGGLALALLTLVFTAFLGFMVVQTARQFMAGLCQADEIERQRSMLDLVLRDFEAHASDWLWELNLEGQLQHISVHLTRATGLPGSSLLGQFFLDVLHSLQPQPTPPEAAVALSRLNHALRQPKSFTAHVMPWQLNGETRWWSLKAQPLFDEDGEWEGWRGVASDVTAVHRREAELRQWALFDGLTGLANRHQLMQALALCLPSEGTARPCALLLMDLDNFKTVNDSLGHSAGDEMLRTVAERLTPHVPAEALLARLGGDEFAVLVTREPERGAVEALAERLREALALPIPVMGRRIDLRVSLGAAFAPTDASTPEGLLRAADLAMYAAKNAGRDRLHCFEPGLSRDAERRLVLAAELRRALERHQLHNVYQPKFNLTTGALVGFEALVRWQHPQRGTVSPSNFIPLAEETGMVLVIGERVLNQACQEALRWPEDLSVAVNVSATQVERGNLVEVVRLALHKHGLPPHRLVLELTESAFLTKRDLVLTQLLRLRELGVHLALDDFGTGYSSLAYLRTLPLNQLKIDRSFVVGLSADPPDPKATAIVAAIVALANGIGATTTAEGLDTRAQVECLRALGCQQGQGHGLGRPMAASEARALIERHVRANVGSA